MFKDKEFNRKLRELMIPLAFQNLMLAAVSAGDSAMLGFVDENAMAAVSLAGNIQFIENMIIGSIIAGGMILMAQYWGKQDKDIVQRLLGLLLRYAGGLAIAFCTASLLFPQRIMTIFTNEPELIALGAEYIRIAAPSYLLTGIVQCWLCAMKSTGQTKQSTIISTSALVLDTVLNAVFIFGFHMGVKGAALTTTISRIVELATVLLYTKKMAVRPSFKRVGKLLHLDFLKCSIPIVLSGIVWGFGTSTFSVILGHLGTAMTAAAAVASIVRQLALSLCRGLGSGGEILLAHVLGSGDLVKGKEYGRRLTHLSIFFGFICCVLALIFGNILSATMTLSDAVRTNLNTMILISAFHVITVSINSVVICCVFTAGGDTAFDAYSVAVTMWGFIIPAAAICGFVLHCNPMIVYLVLSLDEVIKFPWVYAHYKKYKWLRNITRENI